MVRGGMASVAFSENLIWKVDTERQVSWSYYGPVGGAMMEAVATNRRKLSDGRHSMSRTTLSVNVLLLCLIRSPVVLGRVFDETFALIMQRTNGSSLHLRIARGCTVRLTFSSLISVVSL